MRADWRAGGFGVYIHWPFCQSKCPYCDFNSHVWAEIDQARWRAALRAELRTAQAETPNRRVDTVFFGGGTPSLMAPETVAALLEDIADLWEAAPDLEVTLEANPTSVEAARFAGYAAAGVNRVSIGVQALRDDDLKALGRRHSVAEARRALEIARRHFKRVTLDLIYARSGQTPEDWRAELHEALAFASDHVSLYQLTIEPGTAFAARYAAGKLDVPTDDAAAAMYELTQELTAAAGLAAYEVSNHAAPGAESRHNLVYWRYGDYVGVGPGAHGRLTTSCERLATETERDPAKWLAAVEQNGAGRLRSEPIAPRAQAEEMLMMGLRLAEGVSLARFERLADAPLPASALTELTELGFLSRDGDRLRATRSGRFVLNAVLGRLLA